IPWTIIVRIPPQVFCLEILFFARSALRVKNKTVLLCQLTKTGRDVQTRRSAVQNIARNKKQPPQ
ncbi:MAG: hypothetical protein IJ484_01855, partial [Oscillospiraceae bacterium]|nr:hypothetical protein [Oscillospiraceae bacterium]